MSALATLVHRELARHFAIKEALQRDLLALQTHFLKGDVFKGKCKHCQCSMHEDTTVLSLVESSTMSKASTCACFFHMQDECLRIAHDASCMQRSIPKTLFQWTKTDFPDGIGPLACIRNVSTHLETPRRHFLAKINFGAKTSRQ
jgi:hypothetical protein